MNDSRPVRAGTAVARGLSSLTYGSGRTENCKEIQLSAPETQLRHTRSGLPKQRSQISGRESQQFPSIPFIFMQGLQIYDAYQSKRCIH